MDEPSTAGIVMGIITCSSCNKDVPDVLFCVYCGMRLSGEVVVPPLSESERKILSILKTSGEELTVPNIHGIINGSKGRIRVVLSDMARVGLVTKPSRGRYIITKLGEIELKKKDQGSREDGSQIQ